MTIDEAIKDLEKIKKVKFTPTNVPVSIDMAIDALKGVRDASRIITEAFCRPPDDVVSAQDFRDCRNELCLKCGQYQTKHLGSCNGCRWE